MSDKPPARDLTQSSVLAELIDEWDTRPVRRSQVRTLSPRLAELLDALAASTTSPPASES